MSDGVRACGNCCNLSLCKKNLIFILPSFLSIFFLSKSGVLLKTCICMDIKNSLILLDICVM